MNIEDNKKIYIGNRDKTILKELAKKVKSLSERPEEVEKIKLWTKHNDLESVRTMVFCDPENGWNEIITEDMLLCEGEIARIWEKKLRKEISWAEEIKDDKVISPVFEIPYIANEGNWGLFEKRIGGNQGGAYRWESPIKNYEIDLNKLKFPEVNVDFEATQQMKALAEEVVGDYLKVEIKHSWWWTLGLTWELVNLRGLEQMMFDMYDYPDELHQIMRFLRDGTLNKIKILEESELLTGNIGNTYVGSGGFGFTKQLAQSHKKSVKLKGMWGFCESQETTAISPDLFKEFVLPYQIPILEKFGLNCYGCCEPLDLRWKYVKDIPNLRRVSVSAWANVEVMSEFLKKDYIFSYKPNPAPLAIHRMDEDIVRQTIRYMLETTRENKCHVEIIMKDNHTLGKNPYNAFRWVEIAREEIDRLQ